MRISADQCRLSRYSSEIDWNHLFETLSAGEFLVLEQIYVQECGPLSLSTLQSRLRHLNVHPRTITRWCLRLEKNGLVRTVRSCDLQISPVSNIEPNAKRLVRLRQLREKRARFSLGGSLNGN